MKSGKLIVGIAVAVGLYYLLKKAKKLNAVLPAPVNTTNAINQSMASPVDEIIVTPMQQVSDLAKEINSCNVNRINVRYMAGKTHYI